MHDTITVGVPVLAILFGILLNQRGLERLDTRIDKLEARMDARFLQMEGRFSHLEARIDRIQADLAQFYRSLGEHDARLTAVEGKKS